jgi:hypothetical protein
LGELGAALGAFARPLVDRTDGSPKQVQRALRIAMLCWNMALMPAAEQDEFLEDVGGTLRMGEEEFSAFRRDVIDPMIRRHREMFPHMSPIEERGTRNKRCSP